MRRIPRIGFRIKENTKILIPRLNGQDLVAPSPFFETSLTLWVLVQYRYLDGGCRTAGQADLKLHRTKIRFVNHHLVEWPLSRECEKEREKENWIGRYYQWIASRRTTMGGRIVVMEDGHPLVRRMSLYLRSMGPQSWALQSLS